MVITGVAARAPERLGYLVYLDGYLPDDGQSEADLWPGGTLAARQADAAAHGGFNPAPPPEIFGVSDPALLDWIKARSTLQPFACYTEAMPPGNARSASLPGVFIRCTGNPSTTPDLFGQFAVKARAKGWEVRELAEGHLAMLTAPEKVAEYLLEIAGPR